MGGEKFLFDNNMFDDDDLVSMTEEELSAIPEFTKDQLENARNKAFQAGKKAGIKESEEGLTKATLVLLQKIEHDMSVLFEAEHDRVLKYESEAVHLSLVIIQKLFPLYTKEYGGRELEAAIKSTLTNHNIPTKIEIEMHGDILSNMAKHIGDELNKKITMTMNNNLNKGECNISWANGGIICNRDDIAEKILEIMKETLAERGISVHDKEDNEALGET